MKKLFFAWTLMLLFFAACQGQTDDITQMSTKDSQEVMTVEQNITVNILASHFGGYSKDKKNTRAEGAYTLTPYVDKGDTLLYVAQYEDGWELCSANTAAPMILFSSEKGVFNMEDPDMPTLMKEMILEYAEGIRNIPKGKLKADVSWGAAAITKEQLDNGLITTNRNGRRVVVKPTDLPPGNWVLIDQEEIEEDSYVSPKLIETQWGQRDPFNRYAKCVKDVNGNIVRTVAGCVPVAIGQYEYFTHFKENVPLYSVTEATPISGGMDYTFSGQSSYIWNEMAKTKNDAGSEAVALLLGQIGRDTYANYKEDGTNVYPPDEEYYLNNVYGNIFVTDNMNYTYVKNSLIKGYPVLATALSNKKTNGTYINQVGHMFIIDQYKTTTHSTKYTYGYLRDYGDDGDGDGESGGGDDPYEDNERDDSGNVTGYAYYDEVIVYDYSEDFISMNWGWFGIYDDSFYNPSASEWNAGGYNFNLSHTIYRRSDIK